jgi:hypothetical protein
VFLVPVLFVVVERFSGSEKKHGSTPLPATPATGEASH